MNFVVYDQGASQPLGILTSVNNADDFQGKYATCIIENYINHDIFFNVNLRDSYNIIKEKGLTSFAMTHTIEEVGGTRREKTYSVYVVNEY